MKSSWIVTFIAGVVAIGLPTANALRYTISNEKLTFFGAWQQCIEQGGTLATIETPRQNAQVLTAIKKSGKVADNWWLSGADLGLEGSWIWLSNNKPVGRSSGFVNFAASEPNNTGAGGEHCMSAQEKEAAPPHQELAPHPSIHQSHGARARDSTLAREARKGNFHTRFSWQHAKAFPKAWLAFRYPITRDPIGASV
uniref:C-type lectin domain-containing protein n=1 Tax=Anopheles culicifacies TaxID=139723 RepID=A0A182LWP0_9DIPT